MSETDSNANNNASFMPYIIAVVVVVAVLIGAFFLLSDSEEKQPERLTIEPPVITEPDPEPVVEEPEIVEPEIEPEPEFVEPIMPEPEPEPEPEPLDISDGAVKAAIMALTEMPSIGRLLVDEELLRRFVVFTYNLADSQLAENHHLLQTPASSFRVYRQANKEWIDSASYQRYTVYAEMLDSMSTEALLSLYQTYKPAIAEVFAEISEPDANFDDTLLDAIDHLLDTPEIPVPVEVYTDSVMYKYRIERIEDLSAPQKQLLRTGPENMRLIKSKLRELKDALSI
ncbi:MAG: DUF3014 domain-containing protein [Alteromonadaceae bacterium]|nr:DUF3014 domain-containing protein [Alteromonadaceae bacterium]